MKKLLEKHSLKRRVEEEKGASNTISFIVIIFFVMVMLVSLVDIGIYFNVKNEMRGAAEAGARNVALYGGTGGDLRGLRSGVNDAVEVADAAIKSKYKNEGGKMPVVELGEIECGPEKADHAGDGVFCKVSYKYNGIAGNFNMFRLNETEVTVKGVAVAEVGHTEKSREN